MGEPPSLPENPTPDSPAHGGITVQGGAVRAGRDIVGGDVNIAGDSISGSNINVQRGYSADQVQRLLIIVGALVFATAAFFFIVGAISAAALVSVLNRPLNSSDAGAGRMQQKIDALNSLPSGQQFRVNFTEDELSSYFRFVLGPEIGVTDGKARLMDDPGKIALGGNLTSAGGLKFLAELQVTQENVPLQVRGAWLKILPTPDGSSFGWIPITPFVQNLNGKLNDALFGKVQFTAVQQTGGGAAAPPEIGNNLLLQGVVK